MNKPITLLLVIVVVILSASITALVLTRASVPDEVSATPARSSRVVKSRPAEARAVAPAVRPDGNAGAPTAPRELLVDLDSIPDPLRIDRTHPGFAAAYKKAFDADLARSMKVAHRRCMAKIPPSVKQVAWDTLETFTSSPDGAAMIRSDIELFPQSDDGLSFTSCVMEAIQRNPALRVAFTGPSDGSPIQIRNAGTVFVADLDAQEIALELEALRERARDSSLSDDRRAILQDQIELYDCYQRLGIARRLDCLAR